MLQATRRNSASAEIHCGRPSQCVKNLLPLTPSIAIYIFVFLCTYFFSSIALPLRDDIPKKSSRSFGFCPNYLLLLSSKSPQMMIFDVIMSRFPQNYSPQIIYDNACKSKEFGLNRETRRFMQIQIKCDKFHETNHTSCGRSFKSSEYIQLLGKILRLA